MGNHIITSGPLKAFGALEHPRLWPQALHELPVPEGPATEINIRRPQVPKAIANNG